MKTTIKLQSCKTISNSKIVKTTFSIKKYSENGFYARYAVPNILKSVNLRSDTLIYWYTFKPRHGDI